MQSVFACQAIVAIAVVCLCSCGPKPDQEYRRDFALFRDGDFDGAALRAHQAWKNRSPSEWYWRFRLLEAESLMEAGKLDQAAVPLGNGSSAGSPEFEIRSRILNARRAARVSDFGRARALLDEARKLAVQNSRTDFEPEIDSGIGDIFARQHQLAQAEAAFEHTRASAKAAADDFHEASAINNLGMLRFLRSRCDEAIPLFEQAGSMWRDEAAHHWALIAANNLLVCYNQLGDYDRALTAYEAIRGHMRPGILLSRALNEMGRTFLSQFEPQKAAPYFRQSMEMASQFGANGDAARAAGNLTIALTDAGDWNGAESALKKANELSPEPRSRPYLDLDAAAIAQGRKQFAGSRATCERALHSNAADSGARWMAYACIAAGWLGEGNGEMANRNFEAAIKIIEGNQTDLGGRANKITFLARLINFYQDYVEALIKQNDPLKALAVADGSRARVLSQRVEGKLAAPAPQRPSEFSAIARQSGAVWMSYWLAPQRSFLWVTGPKETRFFELPPSGEIGKLAEEYRGFIETSMRDPLTVHSDAGRRLYQILIQPAAMLIAPGAHVIVVPDGPLLQLSFETLPVYGAQPHYWMDDVTIAVAPSLGGYEQGRERGSDHKTLILGNPISPGSKFPPLPHAAEEIAEVQKHLGAASRNVITGQAAAPDAWSRVNPGDFDTIHIAAHAESNSSSPLDSAIILSPDNSGFRLLARDIIKVPLHAGLVTLSACRSSGARTYAGEGLVGLTWAFLQAGAQNVVAGLWDVSDESTAVFMDGFYSAIAKGVAPADALQSARLAVRKTAYAKPYYWGAFQCYLR